jgi:hypothetical protein
VNAITNNSPPFIGDGGFAPEVVFFVTRVIRVFLDFDSVWPSSLESADGHIKIVKVLFGPVNLYADATKVSHDHERRPDEGPRISEGDTSFSDYASKTA